MQNFGSEKLAHLICAKKLKSVQKQAKLPKIPQKNAKTFIKLSYPVKIP